MEPTDGKISLPELIRVTKAEENVGDSFYAADTNGDGEISRCVTTYDAGGGRECQLYLNEQV